MTDITTDQLREMLAGGVPVTVVDVRDAPSFEGWHIHGSFNVPVIEALRMRDAAPLEQAATDLPSDRPIVTVCNVGVSSRFAADVLSSLGRETYNLAGGIRAWSLAWSEAPIKLTAPPDATFLQIRRNGKGCLSYLLGTGEGAAVVDPAVDASVYVDLAQREGLTITHVIETHVHADHISRARDLCARTGATLWLPANGRATYDFNVIHDGDELNIGGVHLRAINTPGHTGESTCYLIENEILLSGDTLFVESVGRPDLEKGDAGAEPGAHMLFDSLQERIFTLPDSIRVYPAHTGGGIEFDGRPIGATLGDLRASVDLLGVDRQSFVQQILAGLPAKPPSHEIVISVNEGKTSVAGIDPLDIEAGPNRCAAT